MGGLERLVVEWANYRNRENPGSTRIVCLDTPGDLAAQVDGGAVDCVNACRARRPMDWAAVLRLRRLFLKTGAEVIHSHNVAAWQYAALACLGTKVRHIHTEHGTNVHYEGIVNRVRLAVIRRLTDQIVAVSESAAEELVIKNRIPRKDIVVIVNGVGERQESGVTSQKSEVREKMGISKDAFVMGSVGRLAQVKGYDRLIAAFAAINRSQTLAHRPQTLDPSEAQSNVYGLMSIVSSPFLLLTGDGPERAALEQQARDLGVSDRVIFAGYQAEPAPYLAAMNLFVLPSRSEGLSVALLEAMAAGVLVAVTDVGANREVVENGKCGLILPDDETQWTEMLNVAMGRGEWVAGKIQFAQKRVREHYSLKVTMGGYERIYGTYNLPQDRKLGKRGHPWL